MRPRISARLVRACLAIALALAIQVVTALVALGGSGGGDWPRRLFIN
jgi:hypothetical protein